MNARNPSLASVIAAVTLIMTAFPVHAVDLPPVPANTVALSAYGGVPGASSATIVSAFDQAFTRLKSLGGGTLVVAPGVYSLGNVSQSGIRIVANNLRNVVVSAYGAQLTVNTTDDSITGFMHFNNPNNVTIKGLSFTDFGADITKQGPWRGAACLTVNASVPSSGFKTVDCVADRVLTFFRSQGDNYTFTGFDIHGTVKNSYYGVNPNTTGRFSRCDVTCVNVRRGFISYGARNWDIRMSCHNTGSIGSNGFIDLIPDSATPSQDCTIDLTVTGTTNNYSSLIHLYHQGSGFQYMRNIRANITLNNATGTSIAFLFTAPNSSRSWEQIALTGTIIGGYSGPIIANPLVSTAANNHVSVAANLAAYQDMSRLPSYFHVVAAATAPAITAQPVARTVTAGQTATFSVGASGTGPLSYQWRRNGTTIAGATAATYTTPSTTVADSGARYDVRVANSEGSVISAAATLTVIPAATPPAITTQPVARTVTAGQTATFSVGASGTGPLSYQWRRNGTTIAGATAATYTTPPTTVADNGARYDVRVANSQGSTISAAATLTVTPATPPPGTIDPARIAKENGFAYIVTQDFGTAADTNASPTASILRVYEDGREIGPAHTGHADIRSVGRGRFSHWSNGTAQALYFSTSDNSDPRSNGRRYTFSVGAPAGALPSGWTTADIGAVNAAGSATQANGIWTVTGSGADIWGSADGFRYAYRPFRGDGEIIARVASQGNTDGWAKAGVMIRETTAAGSRHALLAATPVNGLAFQYRLATAGTSTHTGVSRGTPVWVKLVRVGNTFSGYESANGTSWTLVGSATIAMGADVTIGLAVSAHSNGALSTATFTDVTVTAAPSGNG